MLAIDPGRDAALNAKGAALIDLGKFNDAIPFFDKALGINSMNMQALLHVLDNSLLINASNPTVLTYKAFDLDGLGKYNQSMVFLDKAFAVNPRNPYTLAVKGLALDRLGKTNEAIQFYN